MLRTIRVALFFLYFIARGFVADASDQAFGRACQVAQICLQQAPKFCGVILDVATIRDSRVPIERRCYAARELAERGVPLESKGANELLDMLGREFLLQYQISGQVAVSAHKLAYLLDHLPLAAKLMRVYQGGDYYAQVLEDQHGVVVKGGKGERFKGQARLLAGSAKQGRLFYHGRGGAQFGKWSFSGEVYIDFEFRPEGRRSKVSQYRIISLASPSNAWLNELMDSEPFRYVSETIITGIIEDLAMAVRAVEWDWRKDQLDSTLWTADELEQIRRLVKLR